MGFGVGVCRRWCTLADRRAAGIPGIGRVGRRSAPLWAHHLAGPGCCAIRALGPAPRRPHRCRARPLPADPLRRGHRRPPFLRGRESFTARRCGCSNLPPRPQGLARPRAHDSFRTPRRSRATALIACSRRTGTNNGPDERRGQLGEDEPRPRAVEAVRHRSVWWRREDPAGLPRFLSALPAHSAREDHDPAHPAPPQPGRMDAGRAECSSPVPGRRTGQSPDAAGMRSLSGREAWPVRHAHCRPRHGVPVIHQGACLTNPTR